MMVVCQRMDELGATKRVLMKMVQLKKKEKWMIWISDDIDQLLLGAAAAAAVAAGPAALRGWFRTSWLASIIIFVVLKE